MKSNSPGQYFDWVKGRLGWAQGAYWKSIDFEDGSKWRKIFLGLYWKVKKAQKQPQERPKWKVSTNSWHYKIVNKSFTFGASRDLCKYFWQVVGCLIGWPIVFVAVLAVFGAFLYALFGMVALPLYYLMPDLWFVTEDVAAVGFFGYAAVAAAFCAFMHHRFQNRSATEKPPSIVTQYIKAKKEKICPILEFDDD